MEVSVSGHKFLFPTICACCCGPANTVLEVETTKEFGEKTVSEQTNTWEVPYCRKCIKHVDASGSEGCLILGIPIVSVVSGAVFFLFYNRLTIATLLSIVTFASGIFFTIKSYISDSTAAEKMLSSNCACLNEAAEYVDWQGTIHIFSFESTDYATAFLVANERKLVNLTEECSKLLAANRHRTFSATAKSPKKYRDYY